VCFITAAVTLAVAVTVDACNNRIPQKIYCTTEPTNSSCSGGAVLCINRITDVADKENDFGETEKTLEKTTATTAEDGGVCYSYKKCKKEGLTGCIAGDAAEHKEPIYVGNQC